MTYDPVKCPAHYAGDGKIACMDAMRSMMAGYVEEGADGMAAYWSLTALKYLWRWPGKNGVQDLEKARQCISYAIDACLSPEPNPGQMQGNACARKRCKEEEWASAKE